MNITLLDENLIPISPIDSYISFIWTDRYQECGDFEWYTSMNDPLRELVHVGCYIVNDQSEHAMIVECIEVETDVEEGDKFKVTGRSLESILDRRIVWTQTNISGKIQNGVKKLLKENVYAPSNAKRKIDNFIFEENTDERFKDLTIEAQFTGDNIYEVICEMCTSYNMGFKLVFDEVYNMVFSLYLGVDHTLETPGIPMVKFAPYFDNVMNTDYIEDYTTYKNVTLVAGEGEGVDRKTVAIGNSEGLERRELFTDARDISSNVEEGTMPAAEYEKLLKERGNEKLAEVAVLYSFSGQVETLNTFIYGRDYYLGDIVTLVNDYGYEGSVRVDEMVMSEDESGYSAYPTFSVVEV